MYKRQNNNFQEQIKTWINKLPIQNLQPKEEDEILRENPEMVKENIKKKFQDKKLPLVDEIKELVIDENPSVICAEKFLIEKLSEILKEKEYSSDYGWVRVLSNHYECENSCVELAVEDEDFIEISKLIKKSEGTVKTWLARGRMALKEKLEGGFENE